MICPEELAALVSGVAIGLSNGRSLEELNLMTVIFTQLADTLATIAVQRSHIEARFDRNIRTSLSIGKKETPADI